MSSMNVLMFVLLILGTRVQALLLGSTVWLRKTGLQMSPPSSNVVMTVGAGLAATGAYVGMVSPSYPVSHLMLALYAAGMALTIAGGVAAYRHLTQKGGWRAAAVMLRRLLLARGTGSSRSSR